eukprot:sb/3466537/
MSSVPVVWNSHVFFLPIVLYYPDHRNWDHILALIIFLATVVGVPGNATALYYFTLRSPKKDIATCVYMFMCGVDLLTGLCGLPVLELRREKDTLVLSASRIVVILRPYIRLQRRYIFIAIGVWVVYEVIEGVVFTLTTKDSYKIEYSTSTVYCTFVSNPTVSEFDNNQLWELLPNLSYIIPTCIVLISFAVSAGYLLRRNHGSGTSRNRRATVTIATLTGIFLVTTAPFIVIDIYYLIDMMAGTYPEPVKYWHKYMTIRTGDCAHVLPCVNAGINPVVYLIRIPKYAAWAADSITGGAREVATTGSAPGGGGSQQPTRPGGALVVIQNSTQNTGL